MRRREDELSLSRRLAVSLVAAAGWALVQVISRTIRYETLGSEILEEFRRRRQPVIFCFWHNQIFSGTWLFRGQGIVVMTSRHQDGEFIARIIRRFGFGTARGSSTRGAVAALLEMARRLEEGQDVAFTVDGPRGPVYQAKPGPIQLARRTGAPILPFHAEVERRWTLRSWDGFRIPKPFTRGVLEFAEPIHVPPSSDLEAGLACLQSRLDSLRARAERRFGRGSALPAGETS
ncbi:MAG: lysophospholipid acyltransferase family protein [Acidobacteriota bacterium]